MAVNLFAAYKKQNTSTPLDGGISENVILSKVNLGYDYDKFMAAVAKTNNPYPEEGEDTYEPTITKDNAKVENVLMDLTFSKIDPATRTLKESSSVRMMDFDCTRDSIVKDVLDRVDMLDQCLIVNQFTQEDREQKFHGLLWTNTVIADMLQNMTEAQAEDGTVIDNILSNLSDDDVLTKVEFNIRNAFYALIRPKLSNKNASLGRIKLVLSKDGKYAQLPYSGMFFEPMEGPHAVAAAESELKIQEWEKKGFEARKNGGQDAGAKAGTIPAGVPQTAGTPQQAQATTTAAPGTTNTQAGVNPMSI